MIELEEVFFRIRFEDIYKDIDNQKMLYYYWNNYD